MTAFDDSYPRKTQVSGVPAELDEASVKGFVKGLAKSVLNLAAKPIKGTVAAATKKIRSRKMAKQPQNEKALRSVCAIDLQRIFALLHAKAFDEASKLLKDVGGVIENTAADGNDPENVVFHSAGEHMITARAEDEGGKIPKKDAIAAIKKYVGTFCGEDVVKKLDDNKDILPLPDESGPDGGEKEGADDTDVDLETNEGRAFDMTFTRYLAESAGWDILVEAPAGKTKAGDDLDSDGEEGNDEENGEGGKEGSAEDDGDEGDDEDTGAEGNTGDDGEEGDTGEGGDDQAGKDGEKGKDGESAPGYYLLYGLKIKGMKETTAADILKRWGSNFIKGFGVKLSYAWGGDGGEIGVMDFVKAGRGLFGAIDDPDELANEIEQKIKKKFPKLTVDCDFRDKKTLIQDLDKKKRRDYDDKARQKISSADYSLCVEIKETNPIQPFMTRKTLAHIVTMSINGLFKAFKNMVKADDVILLHGAQTETRNEKKLNKLEEDLPEIADIENILKKKNTSDAYIAINRKFQRVSKDDEYQNSRTCRVAIGIWRKITKQYPAAADLEKKFGTDAKLAFRDFFNEYAQFRHDYFEEKLSKAEDVFESDAIPVSYDILRILFENQNPADYIEAVFEEETQTADAGTQAQASSNQSETSSDAVKQADTADTSKQADNSDNAKSANDGSDKEIYFAVSENRETPDPAKIEEWLNDSKPVALSALTDDMLEQFKAQAVSAVQDDVINESGLLYEYTADDGVSYGLLSEEEGDLGDEDGGDEDISIDSDPIKRWAFDSWVPDPNQKDKLEINGKSPDGKTDAIVICAKFKKEESASGESEPGPEQAENEGPVDLYIIPMPGVKYRNEDRDTGFEK